MYAFAARHARAIVFLLATVLLGGVYVATQMPVSLFPNVTFPRVVILADNGEQPAERMMVEVTKPLEEAANAVPGVTLVRSITARGSAEISIFFRWGTDIPQALTYLNVRLAALHTVLPPTATLEIDRMTPAVFPVLGYSLTSDSVDLVALRDLALYTLRPALTRVPGVAQVRIQGGRTREWIVRLDPDRLAAHHLDVRRVSEAIGRTNIVGAAGLVRDNATLDLTLVHDLMTSPDSVARIPVAVVDGAMVTVGDVGTVAPGERVEVTRFTANGRQAVLVNIIQQPYGNTVEIGREIRARLAALQAALPKGITVQSFYDQAAFIADSIRGTRDSILIGLALAMLVLVVFLRDWRITLVAVVVVSATIAATLLLLFAVGQTINIMTLGGMAAAIGLIIDDVLVVVENIFRHAEEARGDLRATAPVAVRELLPAMIGSSLATLVIHVPFAFLGGVAGAFFAALSITMVFALTVSFFCSILAAPVLTTMAAGRGPMVPHTTGHSRLRGAYERWLRALLRWPWLALPVLAVLVGGGWWLYGTTESSFLPDMDEGAIILDYTAPPGTAPDETNRMLMQVDEIIRATPDVRSYSRRTGTELGLFLTEPNRGDYAIRLTGGPRRPVDAVIADLRARVTRAVPQLQIDFGQILEDAIGDMLSSPAPVEIKVFGEDKPLIERTARQVAAAIDSVRGVVDVFNGVVVSGPALLVTVDAARAARVGLTTDDVREQLATVVEGDVRSVVQSGEKLIGIRVRYPDAYRTDVHALEQVQLASPAGFPVPLGTIASVTRTPGQSEVRRENLKQMVAVTARLEGRDLGGAMREIAATLRRSLALPAGVTLGFGGLYESQQESFRGLLMVLGAAALLVCVVLVFEFESLRVPLLVGLVNVPALAGVVFALWLTGVSFNLSSFVGMILIVGIVAENAIFVLHYIRAFRASGMAIDDAIVTACGRRARPVLMTMMAAIVALLPLAVGVGSGSQMQQPLAIAIIGGFSVSSLLLLFVLPMLYTMLYREGAA